MAAASPSMDTRILRALRRVVDDGVSGAELAQQLGVSRAAVWARIEELRSLGYDISASPHQGYELISTPDALHADDLLSRLPVAQLIGRDIRVFEQTGSTNDVVEKLARDGVAEGVVVFAESQTRGRGRLGRKWESPPRKGLWFSVLLRPRLRPQAATQITVATAVALARAVRTTAGVVTEIKWPNDLLIRGRKVAGILTEMSAEPDLIKHITVGIGIDVNVTARDLPESLRSIATSLRIATGRPVDRPRLAAECLRELESVYGCVGAGRFGEIAQEWEAGCTTIGGHVTVRLGARAVQGRAESLDADGALMVRTGHGRLERIVGGDVEVEK